MYFMVPILKHLTLNPGNPSNYRPITMSPIDTTLLELLVVPRNVPLFTNKFGFS
ncbi:hypothetical protein LSH36_286g02027 [Paralvinella palmiformis]|uniref:Uncharacterized protein n=1 Tax=Paralvinella palmiformis TaxID=53620 RepID=A0AAD9JJD8_9ANNE|nr:hypothetical protein LSH36_286g02027 [Paralvinella palmiformis]